MNNVNEVVSKNLKYARIRQDWSQAFVSELTGISIRSISRAETGCSVSKPTLKKLCNLYHIPIASLYKDCVQKESKAVQVVPDDVAVGLLVRNSFIQDLEQEVLLRYTSAVQKKALMVREDVEQIIPEAISVKKTYSLSDVITACMFVNQQTIGKMKKFVIE